MAKGNNINFIPFQAYVHCVAQPGRTLRAVPLHVAQLATWQLLFSVLFIFGKVMDFYFSIYTKDLCFLYRPVKPESDK